MDLLSEIYEQYKARAAKREDISSIPVLWGPFLEMLEETINSATQQVFGEWPYEYRMEMAEPTLWVKEFFKKSKSKDKSIGHQNDSLVYKRRTALMNMFHYRNYEAHYNPQDAPTKREIRKLEKQIGEFIEGLRINPDFISKVNEIITSDGRQRHFKATPYSIGAHFKSVICSVSIKKTLLKNNKDMPWVDYCLSRTTDDLINEYCLDLKETDINQRFQEALDEIESDFNFRTEDTPLFKDQLFKLSKLLTKTLKNIYQADFNNKAKNIFDKHKLIKRFQQWKHIFNENAPEIEEDNSKVFLLQISSSPDGNQISINGLWYFSRENSKWSSKRLHIDSFDIQDPVTEFVKKVRKLIDDACDKEDIYVPYQECILLIESDYLACQNKRFSTLFEWGHLDYKLKRLKFMGVFTMLKRKHFEWRESYAWNLNCEREGFSRREIRPASHQSICTKKDLSYLRSVAQIQNMWVSQDLSSKILLIEKPSPSYRESINYYNLDKSVVTFGHPEAIHTVYQLLQTKGELLLRDFCELIGQYNHSQPKHTDKYVTVLFSYKEWEPPSPIQRMRKKKPRSNNEYLANS